MKSKERVLSAVRRSKADRLPFYIMGFYEEESQKNILKIERDRIKELLNISKAKFASLRAQYKEELNAVDSYYSEVIDKTKRHNELVCHRF